MAGSASVEIGETFGERHRFTPEEVSTFSTSIGDRNPLHHDAEHAARSRYGALIVSGTHTTALLMGLTAAHFSKRDRVVGVAFSVRLRRPVLANAEVTLEWVVVGVAPHRSGGVLVDMTGSIRDEGGRDCVTATGQVLVGFDPEDDAASDATPR